MFLLLNLSLRASQKNILCLPWQEVFQSHLKIGSAWECPVKVLYALEDENCEEPQIYVQVSFKSLGTKDENSSWSSCNCVYASIDTGKLKRSWKTAVLWALFRLIVLFFVKEYSSGNYSFLTWPFQRSSQRRHVCPQATVTFAIPLYLSNNFRASLHQKEPFGTLELGNLPFL